MNVYDWLAYVVSKQTSETPYSVYVMITLPPQGGVVLPPFTQPASAATQPNASFYGYECLRWAAQYIEAMIEVGGVIRSVSVGWPGGMEFWGHADLVQLGEWVPKVPLAEIER